MTDEQLAAWARKHHSIIIAGLALCALHYGDPTGAYDAVRECNPDADWDAWIANSEKLRAEMRAQQDGPGIPVQPVA